ncbi:MAG: oligoribonuclease [Bifidobacteriaceae bacterium]|jgi:oligoribonuclease|nr:oligoribonuclease [Bifidobacteriaceae bacterium]
MKVETRTIPDKTNLNKAVLFWVDLEMTGLDPQFDRILEIAAVVTDWGLNEIAKFKAVQKVDPKILQNRMVGSFWQANSQTRQKLIQQNLQFSQEGKALSSTDLEKAVLQFLDLHFGKNSSPYLAGNSIHQDRKFIAQEWPTLNQRLHYRMLDVSAFKLIFENVYGKVFQKKKTHRAQDDIKESIEELKFYKKFIAL